MFFFARDETEKWVNQQTGTVAPTCRCGSYWYICQSDTSKTAPDHELMT